MKKLTLIISLFLISIFSYGKKIDHILCVNETQESIVMYKFVGNNFAYYFEDSEYEIITDDNYRKTLNKQLKNLKRKKVGKRIIIKNETHLIFDKEKNNITTISSNYDFIIWYIH